MLDMPQQRPEARESLDVDQKRARWRAATFQLPRRLPNAPGYLLTILAGLVATDCSRVAVEGSPLTADVPLHLEDHLDVAAVGGSDVPDDLLAPIEWRFDEPQPDWRPSIPLVEGFEPAAASRGDGSMGFSLTEGNRNPRNRRLAGTIYVGLDDLSLQDWSHVEIEARADGARNLGVGFNYTEQDPQSELFPFYSGGPSVPLVSDGTVQTYRIPLEAERPWKGPWTDLEIWFNSARGARAAALDLYSVRLVPAAQEFAAAPVGVVMHGRATGKPVQEAPHRRSLYVHAPARLTYPLKVPPAARFDFGLRVLREEPPVRFVVRVERGDGMAESLFDESHADPNTWADRSISLSHLAGRTVDLVLEANAEDSGTVALWGTPTVSGERTTTMPNVIFYVIDGAGADYMSVYGYNRRTTPNLERIAAEGAVFENAYSNSSWTLPSTPSFLTSLQHSVLGGARNGRNPVPANVLTMAEHMHRAGFLTAALTTNPNAGRISSLERGVDVFREAGPLVHSLSSVELHENFWRWRSAYGGEPYWVHFQTTDVHEPHNPVPPFAGLFISPERYRELMAWDERERDGSSDGSGVWRGWFEETGVDRVAYASAFRDAYDEDMAHQDYQLGRLVARLKERGEWERTLLIVAADHGAAAGSQDWQLLMRESLTPGVDYYSDAHKPMLTPGVSRIPLIVVWPDTIPAGQRFTQPVSMIDVLPTVLDLVGLPMPEIMQGQSLVPLLLGRAGWEERPVIFDMFEVSPESGELSGRIEVIDGRWGASLQINPDRSEPRDVQRPAPLLLFDLWNDPACLRSLHEERPDLVTKYTEFLESQLRAHQMLASRLVAGEQSDLTPDQLRTLRALGYIQ